MDIIRQLGESYPDVEVEEKIVDNMALQLVEDPGRFDVLVAPNLYGDILSDLTAGLMGGLGVAPAANIGQTFGVFEAVHGSAPDIAGERIANPSGLVRSAIMMLRQIQMNKPANRVEKGLTRVLRAGEPVPPDLGGSATTKEMAQGICEKFPRG